MRHRVEHSDLVVRIIGVMNGAARQCAWYVGGLILFSVVVGVLELGVTFGLGWGVSLPLWLKIGVYAACFIGIVLTTMNAHYRTNMLDRWGLYRPSEPMGAGEVVERPDWAVGRAIEAAVRSAAVYTGSNRTPVPLAQSLQQMALVAASTAGFAPALVFMPDIARSGDATISGIGLLLWMMFAFSMLRQGFDTVGDDVDEMLAQE